MWSNNARWSALAFVAAIAACGEAGPSTGPRVGFNLATRPAGAQTSVAASSDLSLHRPPETFTDGTNTLVVSSVEIVLREIELEHDDDVTDCAPELEDDSDCDEEVELEPRLFSVPLGAAGAQRSFSVDVLPGSYRKLEVTVHRLESGDPDDAALIQANPGLEDVSIRVTGTYNGTPFTYTTDLDVELEFEMAPPLEVTEEQGAEITLFIDLASWFRDGSQLLNPASANEGGQNESKVEENIKNSLEAFEDDDQDGIDD